MIRTITEAEAPNLTIPATDELLRGWTGFGIAVVLADEAMGRTRDRLIEVMVWDGTPMSGDDVFTAGEPGIFPVQTREYSALLLPLSRPEVQAHLVGWLGRGAWCPPCGGGGFEGLVETPTRYGCPACGGSATKRGTGYLRPPADLYHLLKPQALGGLPDWIRLALIAGSVERVAAGMSALVDVADMWTEGPHDRGVRSRLSLDRSVCHAQVFPRIFRVVGPTSNPYQYHYDWCCETLPYPGHYDRLGGASAVDTYLMSKSFALIDDTPTGRVIRFEVPDATP